ATGQRHSAPPSRQSSISSRNGSNNLRQSFRVPQFPGERPMLQEYQPSRNGTAKSSPHSDHGQTNGGANRSPHPNRAQREQGSPPKSGADSNGTNQGPYADLDFSNRAEAHKTS